MADDIRNRFSGQDRTAARSLDAVIAASAVTLTLRRYHRFRAVVETGADMPERTLDLLFRFLHQNHGSLSKRGREKEFARLTDAEVTPFEEAHQDCFRWS